jgi:hypothetical protein
MPTTIMTNYQKKVIDAVRSFMGRSSGRKEDFRDYHADGTIRLKFVTYLSPGQINRVEEALRGFNVTVGETDGGHSRGYGGVTFIVYPSATFKKAKPRRRTPYQNHRLKEMSAFWGKPGEKTVKKPKSIEFNRRDLDDLRLHVFVAHRRSDVTTNTALSALIDWSQDNGLEIDWVPYFGVPYFGGDEMALMIRIPHK